VTRLAFQSSTFASTTLFCTVIERGLAADGRLVRFKVAVPDRPGSIARLTELVSQVRRPLGRCNFEWAAQDLVARSR